MDCLEVVGAAVAPTHRGVLPGEGLDVVGGELATDDALDLAQVGDHVGAHQHEEEPEQLGLVERGGRRDLDVVAERLQQRACVLSRGGARGERLGHRARARS